MYCILPRVMVITDLFPKEEGRRHRSSLTALPLPVWQAINNANQPEKNMLTERTKCVLIYKNTLGA